MGPQGAPFQCYAALHFLYWSVTRLQKPLIKHKNTPNFFMSTSIDSGFHCNGLEVCTVSDSKLHRLFTPNNSSKCKIPNFLLVYVEPLGFVTLSESCEH